MQLLKRVVAYLFSKLHVVNDDLPTLDSLTNLGWSAGVDRILWRSRQRILAADTVLLRGGFRCGTYSVDVTACVYRS